MYSSCTSKTTGVFAGTLGLQRMQRRQHDQCTGCLASPDAREHSTRLDARNDQHMRAHLPAAALSGLGKASSPGMYMRRTPPTCMLASPSSKPGMTWPAPTLQTASTQHLVSWQARMRA